MKVVDKLSRHNPKENSLPLYINILEKGLATHSSVLAWRIPWIEELGGLQSTGSQRVRGD